MTESAILRLARLSGADTELLELGVRKVATLEGARYYGVPIGTPIKAAKVKKAAGRGGVPSLKGGSNGKAGPKPPGAGRGRSAAANAPKGAKAPNARAPKGRRPAMSDEEYQERANELSARLKDDWKPKGTDKKFSVDGKGKAWKPKRAALHVKIVQEMYDEEFANVPSDGKALFSGGLGGAGKGTLLGSGRVEGVGDIKKDFGTVNPDDVKEYIVKNYPDMVPKEEGYETGMEASALIHEESSHIALMLAERAYAERKNLVWDITMGSEKSVQSRIDRLRDNGYEDIQAVFIDIPIEVSVKRALGRHRNGVEKKRRFDETGELPRRKDGSPEDEPLGGRFVPPSVIRDQSAGDTSKNKLAFDALRDQFDSWSLWDNGVDNRDAQLVEQGKGRRPASRLNQRLRQVQDQQANRSKLKKGERAELEAERAKLAEQLGKLIASKGFDPDKPGMAEAKLRKRLGEINQMIGFSSIQRLRDLLHL